MDKNENKIALLLVDIQQGLDELEFYGGNRNNPNAEVNCRKLLDFFREHKLPFFFVQHCSTNPASPLFPNKKGHQIKEIVAPATDEVVIQKNVNSAFIGTHLQNKLEQAGITNLIIVGLTTEHCISSTVRMSANLGFSTTVVSDATAAFDKIGPDGVKYEAEIIHMTTLASLQHEFAIVTDTGFLIKELALKHL